MTEHDLSTLVREHVSSDEPPFPGPDLAIARGRRSLRTRRLAAGTGIAAVLAVGGAVLAPQLSADPTGDGPTAIDVAVQEALDSYDARTMPRRIDAVARAVFARTVDDLGPAEFGAHDGQVQQLPPEHYDKASSMRVVYGGGSEHQLQVALGHSRGDAEGNAREYCSEGLADGSYLECTVDTRADGTLTITQLLALRGVGTEHARVVDADELATLEPGRLWFEHTVEVQKSETFVTHVSETVKAPDQASAEELFRVPAADLAEVGADPRLVIPHPPADPASGCEAWLLPGSDVTCE